MRFAKNVVLLVISLILFQGCKQRTDASQSKAIINREGIVTPGQFPGVTARDAVYFVTSNVVCRVDIQSGRSTHQSDIQSFKQTLLNLFQQQNGPGSRPNMDLFFQILSSNQAVKYDDLDVESQKLAYLLYPASEQAESPTQANPNTCNAVLSNNPNNNQNPNPNGGGTVNGDPSRPEYLFFILSYGASFAPDATHTFAVFAHMNPQTGDMTEQVTISWLPIAGSGSAGNGTFSASRDPQTNALKLGAIDTLGGQPRPGWNFGLNSTLDFRAAAVGGRVSTLNNHYVYAMTQQDYNRAKKWRDDLNANTLQILNGGQVGDHFLYQADDRAQFRSCNSGAKPAAMNCHHAVAATWDICQPTAVFSGGAAAEMIRQSLVRGGALSNQPYSKDDNLVLRLVAKAQDAEARNTPKLDAP